MAVRAPRDADFYRLAIFFAAIYFVQGLAEPQAGLATQPIFFLLKDELKLTAGETATFLALVGLAWNVKPLYGLLSDLVPLFGYRRRSYLLITTAMAAAGWLVLGLLPRYPYTLTLVILGLTGLGLAFTDVLCDAVMVEEGKPRGLTGTFQSIQWGAINAASLIAGIGGGYLSAHVSYSRTEQHRHHRVGVAGRLVLRHRGPELADRHQRGRHRRLLAARAVGAGRAPRRAYSGVTSPRRTR